MTFNLHQKILREACMGNEHAYEFLVTIGRVFRVWDDAWDRDRPIGCQEFDTAFSALAFELGRNPFFRLYRDILEAQIFVSWNAWQDANIWESSKDDVKQNCAWYIRDYCNELVPLVAWLIGGKDLARRVSLRMRELFLQDLLEGEIRKEEAPHGALQH